MKRVVLVVLFTIALFGGEWSSASEVGVAVNNWFAFAIGLGGATIGIVGTFWRMKIYQERNTEKITEAHIKIEKLEVKIHELDKKHISHEKDFEKIGHVLEGLTKAIDKLNDKLDFIPKGEKNKTNIS
jgi:peptidoglycan hydrolase CwlO-like protein